MRYNSYPLLTDYFPLLLENGGVVKGLTASCAKCGHDVHKSHLRGEVRESVMNCYRITAIGWCPKCDLMSPYLVHVVPDDSGGYTFVPLDFRGWSEEFDGKVLSFEPGHKKVLASNTG